MSWWQMVAGVSFPLLERPKVPLPHFTSESKLIASIRNYLADVNATIELDKSYIPLLQREHDQHIMDAVINSGKFSTTEIKYINLCRLYLQVVTVSDLATAHGNRIDWNIKKGSPNAVSSKTRCLKCHQAKPQNPQVWAAWSRACALFHNRNGRLYQPLGRWLIASTRQRRQWPAYIDPPHTMYRKVLGGHAKHAPSATVGFEVTETEAVESMPITSVPMSTQSKTQHSLQEPRTQRTSHHPSRDPSHRHHLRSLPARHSRMGTTPVLWTHHQVPALGTSPSHSSRIHSSN